MKNNTILEICLVLEEIATDMGFVFREERTAHSTDRVLASFHLDGRVAPPVLTFDLCALQQVRGMFLLRFDGAPQLSWSGPHGFSQPLQHRKRAFSQEITINSGRPLWREEMKNDVQTVVRSLNWSVGDSLQILDLITFDFQPLFNAGFLGMVIAHVSAREQIAWDAQRKGFLPVESAAACSCALLQILQQWGRHQEAKLCLDRLVKRFGCRNEYVHRLLPGRLGISVQVISHRLRTSELQASALDDAVLAVKPRPARARFIWRQGLVEGAAGNPGSAADYISEYREAVQEGVDRGPPGRSDDALAQMEANVGQVQTVQAIVRMQGGDAIRLAENSRRLLESAFRKGTYPSAQGTLGALVLEAYSRFRFSSYKNERQSSAQVLGSISWFAHRNMIELTADGFSDAVRCLRILDRDFDKLWHSRFGVTIPTVRTVEGLCDELDRCSRGLRVFDPSANLER